MLLKHIEIKNQFFEYKDGKEVSEYNCEDFVSKDTSCSSFIFNLQIRSETVSKQKPKYESDFNLPLYLEKQKKKYYTFQNKILGVFFRQTSRLCKSYYFNRHNLLW
jgi:hypothetical protein